MSADNKVIEIEQIKKLLAHRYPMLLVDRVLDYEPMKRIHAIKNISFNEPQFQGHFPEMAIFPGVMIIEAMAQATGLLASLSFDHMSGGQYLLVAVDDCRFKKMVVPGDVLHLHIEPIGEPRRNMWRFDCVAKVDGQITTKVRLMCAHQK
jgi:3-hydroxyacyl-[acyl-carrier-protein] dehydratase